MRALIKSDLLDRTRWRSLCQILSASFQDCAGCTAGRRTSVVRTTRFPIHQMRTSLSTPSVTVTDRRSPPILWPLPSLALLDFLLIAVVSFRVNEMTSPSVRFFRQTPRCSQISSEIKSLQTGHPKVRDDVGGQTVGPVAQLSPHPNPKPKKV